MRGCLPLDISRPASLITRFRAAVLTRFSMLQGCSLGLRVCCRAACSPPALRSPLDIRGSPPLDISLPESLITHLPPALRLWAARQAPRVEGRRGGGGEILEGTVKICEERIADHLPPDRAGSERLEVFCPCQILPVLRQSPRRAQLSGARQRLWATQLRFPR